jgi:isoleucyl-tRNA synthetase
MLRWMAPFLSFTAEEAWTVLGAAGKVAADKRETIFLDTYLPLAAADEAMLAKWGRIREIREAVNKDIETLRSAGQVGASLQAEVTLTVNPADYGLLSSLGADLKYVFITSAVQLLAADALAIAVNPSTATKCERCWHYCLDVGSVAAHPTLCGRCASNLYGTGEVRTFA